MSAEPLGDGWTRAAPMSLQSALENALPGDIYWLLEGVYRGVFVFTVAGSAESPIIFRAYGGQRATVEGALVVNAAHNWIWGLEVTDPNDIAGDRVGIAAGGDKVLGVPDDLSGIRFINNYVHHIWNNHGLTLWNKGSDQVAYGNIVIDGVQDPTTTRRPHGVYTQNDYDTYGYKYFTNNIFIGAASTCAGCWNFHGFTRTDNVSGMVLEHNMFIDGGVELGGSNQSPTDNMIVRENYFYSAFARFGYHRMFQGTVQDNIFLDSPLRLERLWGDGLADEKPGPTLVTGNTFATREGNPLTVRSYVEGVGIGSPRLDAQDVFDNNIYVQFETPLRFLFAFAGDGPTGVNSLTDWQQATAQAGNAFDSNSTVVSAPTEPTVLVLPNEYDAARFHLGVFNWDGRDSAELTLTALSPGASFTVQSVNNLWGAPIAFGTTEAPFTLPIEYGLNAFVIRLATQ